MRTSEQTAMDARRPAAARAPASPAAAAAGGSANAPAFALPVEHFGAGLAYLVVAAAGLVWISPDLAHGLFPLPRVVAVTHLFTLGWITMSIQGALYQFLPVALGVPIRSERAGHIAFGLYAPGVAMFVAGLAFHATGLTLGGALAFTAGLLVFLGNLSATLARADRRDATWWSLAAAAVFLLVTIVLGLSLAGNLRWGYLGAERMRALGVHLHVALVGWVFLVVAGVARHLLPMFLLSHGAGERALRWAIALGTGGTALLLAVHHARTPWPVWTAGAVMAAGVAAFLLQAALYFRNGRKPTVDAGMRIAGIGLGFLALALVLAPPAVLAGVAAPRLATAYVAAAVLGGFSLFVTGHYYKILPFLVWNHRYGPRIGKRPVPRVADLYAAWPAKLAAALLGIGALGVVLGILAGSVPAVRGAAVAFAGGAAVVAGQLVGVLRRRPE